MSTTVYHGLQSCLEPWMTEPRISRLKLAQASLEIPPQSESKTNQNTPIDSPLTKNDDFGGCSFLQSITTNTSSPTQSTKNANNEEAEEYIHPMAKRSSSLLSEKSLEMCTESLGSETGSITGDQIDEFPFPCFCNYNETSLKQKPREYNTPKRQHSRSMATFPPPLTTMNGFQVKGHREEGRLVIMAVAVEASRACFQAEREDGRLTLRFVEHCLDGDLGLEEDELECDDDDDGDEEIEIGIGVEEVHRRPSRCNEAGGNRDMVPWKHFWVTSS